MYKKDLLAMQPLKATDEMLKVERADVPREVSGRYGGPYRKHPLFTRCQVENDILKVALFFPDALRTGGCLPSYEVFIDRAAKKFITYDRMEDKWRAAKVDRLQWPRYIRSTDDPWMSSDDTKAVQTYLGGKKGCYAGVLEYQEKLRDEALERRHRKETDPWDVDLSLTPGLPRDWDRWVDKVGIPQNYIFYRYKKRGAKQGHCTYCGKDVTLAAKPRHNRTGRCPCCRHEITFKATGKQARFSTGLNCVYLLQPRPDGFVIREFWAERFYRKDAWDCPEVRCHEQRRVILDFQLNRRTYYMGLYKNRTYRWIAGMPSTSYYSPEAKYYAIGDKPGRVYGKTLPRMLTGPLGRTGLLELLRGNGMVANPDDYFYVLKERPQLEQLAKAGLPRLTVESIPNYDYEDSLLKRDLGHGLARAMDIDTQRLGRLRRYNGGQAFLAWLQWEKEQDTQVDDAVILDLCQWDVTPDKLSFILDRMRPLQVRNYLRRQIAGSRMDCDQVLTTWRDYLSMAKKLKMDTDDPIIYRVKLLRRRHDELVVRCQQKDHKRQAVPIRKKFPNVDQICRSLKKKYEYADETYAVIAPNGIVDILVEGTMLCHCIGSSEHYWDRIQRHETYILFLRKVSNPQMPYYTLEIEPDGTVRQKRTKFDRQNSDIVDAKKFLAKWQKVVAERLTGEDRKKAGKSRILREQEFEQMRQDNVIIHAGHLAGRRLVDVLTADLMENAA